MYFETLFRDVSYGLRIMLKAPGLTAVAILSLALGIGANSAAFSVAEAAWLRSWPAQDPDRVGRIVPKTPQGADEAFSYAEYRDIKNQSREFKEILAYATHAMILRTGDESRTIVDEIISPNYFDVLGVNAQLGQTFSAARGFSSYESAVVISDGLWRSVFHADPELIGKQLVLTNRYYTVIGVAPRHFWGLEREVPTQAWVTAEAEDSAADLSNRRFRDFELLGRLRSGVTFGQAQTELNIIGGRLAATYPGFNKDRVLTVISEQERLGDEIFPSLLLMSAVALVLLISTVNVAGLLLARSETRRHEIAIRIALGARRSRLIRQLLTESAMLGLSGGALGLLGAHWFFGLQPSFMPPSEVQLSLNLRLDESVVLFTLIVSAVAVLIVGFTPALLAPRINLIPALKVGEGATGDSRRLFLRSSLVVVEVALSVVLMTASGLLLRSFIYTSRVPLGFDARRNLIFFDLNPNVAGYNDQGSLRYFQDVTDDVRGIPGVENVTFVRRVLLSDFGGGAVRRISIPGIQLPDGQLNVPVKFDAVGPGYFKTFGTRILEGRGFTLADSSSSPLVAVISEAMARRFWPGQDAVGRDVAVEGKGFRIVGVVEDAKINDVHENPEPYIYFPFAQSPTGEGTVVVETARGPRALIGTIRSAIFAVDKHVPVRVRTMRSLLQAAFWTDRITAMVIGALSVLGIFLASVGLYGVTAFLVNRRQREIGIRMALGADRLHVVRLVLVQGLRLSAMGIAIGTAAAFALTRLMANLLYGVRPTDLVSFGGSVVVAVVISVAATSIPALRAIRIDPLASLRCE